MKTCIVADSSANLLHLEGVDFSVVPLKIIAGDWEYVDNSELDVAAMLRQLRDYKGKSGTACPSVGEWTDAFGEADWVFGVAVTSALSGCCGAGRAAAEQYMQTKPGSRVFILDSLSAGPELVLILEKYRELILAGEHFEDICRKIIQYRERTHLVFSLSSLNNFAKNGRVNPTLAAAVGLLGIRIVGCASEEGELKPLHKCRGEKRSLSCMLDCMVEMGYSGGKARLYHSYNEGAALKLAEMIRERFPGSDVSIGQNRGLCCFYAEEGGLLAGFES